MRITKAKWRRLAQGYLQAAADCESHSQRMESDMWSLYYQFGRPPPPDVEWRAEELHRQTAAADRRYWRLLACAKACAARAGDEPVYYLQELFKVRTWSRELSGGKTHAVPDQG